MDGKAGEQDRSVVARKRPAGVLGGEGEGSQPMPFDVVAGPAE
jgi:hypothetical protein